MRTRIVVQNLMENFMNLIMKSKKKDVELNI